MGESPAAASAPKPTFCFEDVHDRLWMYGPDAYDSYEYSADGHWMTLTCREADGRTVRRTFFIGYPA